MDDIRLRESGNLRKLAGGENRHTEFKNLKNIRKFFTGVKSPLFVDFFI